MCKRGCRIDRLHLGLLSFFHRPNSLRKLRADLLRVELWDCKPDIPDSAIIEVAGATT